MSVAAAAQATAIRPQRKIPRLTILSGPAPGDPRLPRCRLRHSRRDFRLVCLDIEHKQNWKIKDSASFADESGQESRILHGDQPNSGNSRAAGREGSLC